MRHFYFIETKSTTKTASLLVLTSVKNRIYALGDKTYRPGSTRGAVSEVLDFLANDESEFTKCVKKSYAGHYCFSCSRDGVIETEITTGSNDPKPVYTTAFRIEQLYR